MSGSRQIRYPRPLQPGDRIGVTSPSSGVDDDLRPRLEFAVDYLRARDFEVVVGECMDGTGIVSATSHERADEFMSMMLDPSIRAVVPPWGGELAIDLLSLIDFDAISAAEPTWLLGYSDVTTLMLPLTLLCGVASVHAPNLMDTPYRVEPPLLHWIDVLQRPIGESFTQGAASHHMARGYHDYRTEPHIRDWGPTAPAQWKTMFGETDVDVTGRLIGGCLETLSMFAGSRYGDVPKFAHEFAPEGTLVYLEVAEAGSLTAARMFHGLRLAGWFDNANAVLLGRPAGPNDEDHFTQFDAIADALGSLTIPVIYDMDFGHVPPQGVLINGALARVQVNDDAQSITQQTA